MQSGGLVLITPERGKLAILRAHRYPSRRMIRFFCPQCGQRITADDDYSGSTAECPTCSHKFAVPALIPPSFPAPKAVPQENLCGIRGWLLIPAATVVLSPIIYSILILLEARNEYPPPNMVSMMFGVAFVGFSIVLIPFFFMKKKEAIPLFIAWMIADAVYAVVGLWAYPTDHPRLSFVSTFLWIGYFLRSKRV
jgi:DNA-directed RNA polymerase subunit RPC12/RpoP